MIDAIYSNKAGHIHVRRVITVEGKETYHRNVVSPVDSLKDMGTDIKQLANEVWTPKIINAYLSILSSAL